MKLACVFALMLIGVPLRASSPAESRPQELLAASLRFSETHWDDSAALLWSPAEGEAKVHCVRESAWYALGLLMRDRPGDTARAVRIIERVLANQFAAPGWPWDGTYRRAPEEADPPAADAKVWEHYDPNWRQFIGTTFALILIEFEPRLPADLPARMVDSMRRAVEGEISHQRLTPDYTNIALMHGFLWGYVGTRLSRSEWVAAGEDWADRVRALYAPHESFEEYNSPTYYGVDLYGLALWRRHGATEKIRAWGSEMEAGLWRDIGRFYHAGLRNMCGPFDRSYGMDMRRYVSLTGVWMAMVLPPELMPLPDPSGPMEHAHDFVCAPTYVALGAQVPADVLAGFRAFQGERLLRRPIEGPRTATAWLAADVMLGGEITGAARPAGPGTRYNQFHPATIHWRVLGGEVGWMRLHAAPAVDAEAAKAMLTITAPAAGDFAYEVFAPGSILRSLPATAGSCRDSRCPSTLTRPGLPSCRPAAGSTYATRAPRASCCGWSPGCEAGGGHRFASGSRGRGLTRARIPREQNGAAGRGVAAKVIGGKQWISGEVFQLIFPLGILPF